MSSDATAHWQKSSYSAEGNNCLEVAIVGPARAIHLRESDEPDTVLTSSPARLRALLLLTRSCPWMS